LHFLPYRRRGRSEFGLGSPVPNAGSELGPMRGSELLGRLEAAVHVLHPRAHEGSLGQSQAA
jgi:hypothetical protein